ncbi:L-seryl-tRNA(ser) selenium transferase [Alcanivorax balearicus MACL04]|uniref:L-seryl-tRNA(Ser) selenium transferase n=1 Tax=Alloalcanivorax balearicus MACL04 TaxID=1177182 RepID=A0ABT2QWV5_9GAMM|nr:L-seryl-tRNA(ser) selenium transferase [Alloalcanivorax balearicus MACL04]
MPGGKIAVAGLLLAAGEARRMGSGGQHKLLAEFDGCALVRRSAQTLLSSRLCPVIVVTGHRYRQIEAELQGLEVEALLNPAYTTGMGSSLACGFSHQAIAEADGTLVMLADMPAINPDHIDRLVRTFRQHGGNVIVRASCNGQRGNPVIIPKALYGAMRHLSGDSGARSLVERSELPIVDVETGPAALLDVDTPEAVIRAGGVLKN